MIRHYDMRRHGPRIYLELDNSVRRIDFNTIQETLPAYCRDNGRKILHQRALSMSEWMRHVDAEGMKALRLIFSYLTEIDRPGHVSSAITKGLEARLETSYSRYGHDRSAASLFNALGDLLCPESLGCGLRVFKQMEAFFLKHNEAILAQPSGVIYIAALDRLSYNGKRDMSPALECLVREREAMRAPMVDPRYLRYLCAKSRKILKILWHRSSQKALRHNHSALQLNRRYLRPRPIHRPHSHDCDFRPPLPASIPGSALHLEDLVAIWERNPDQLVFHPRIPGCGVRGPPLDHGTGYLEDETDMISDEEGQLPAPWDDQHLLEYGMHPAYNRPMGHPFMDAGFGPRRRRPLSRMIEY